MANNSNKSGRLIGTALFAIWPTLFSFAYNVLTMFTSHTSVGDVFLGTFVCWLIFWFISYSVMDITDGLREEANRPRDNHLDQRPDDQNGDNSGSGTANTDTTGKDGKDNKDSGSGNSK